MHLCVCMCVWVYVCVCMCAQIYCDPVITCLAMEFEVCMSTYTYSAVIVRLAVCAITAPFAFAGR